MIRKACLKDISRLAEILIFAKRTAYRPIFQEDKVSFGEMQVLPLAQSFIENPNLLESILVFEDEFVKGMMNISEAMSPQGERSIEIEELYIDPFFQGKGVGEALLAEAVLAGKENGSGLITLWVLEKNHVARGFYEKHSFGPTGERKPEEGTSEHVLRYKKVLEV